MKKPAFWIASAVILIGLGAWLWRTVISPPPYIEVSPLSYTDYASWSVIPKETPPAVWKDGWATDVFLVEDASELKGRTGAQLDRKEQKARLQGRLLEDGLAAIGPVYAPLYRADAKGDDLSRAFLIYLRNHNQGRAVVIAADTVLPDALLSELELEPELMDRFGGFYRIGKDPEAVLLTETPDKSIEAYCPPHLMERSACVIDVATVREKGFSVLAPDSAVGESAEAFNNWLAANASPMAEPLGDLEEVEIVDIRRPGDTDERRSKRKNRD
ncbi:hypothetical protein [Hyphomonas jannaschiana]|uniref:Uncharacterized protein n=1 Tax=Hyphomonas jannaschiana VP2 TaxID=1280952 RepID=A0A059FB34_9PROT|nr:hypothetical protein [Hyphomonas jannaschiana]KCZ87824.1 hypothetical protein HJA_12509 [Hyphomonas jannaschiana VP2]